jgi:hypothetical protein
MERPSEICRVLFQNKINLRYCASDWFCYRNILRCCTVLQTSNKLLSFGVVFSALFTIQLNTYILKTQLCIIQDNQLHVANCNKAIVRLYIRITKIKVKTANYANQDFFILSIFIPCIIFITLVFRLVHLFFKKVLMYKVLVSKQRS